MNPAVSSEISLEPRARERPETNSFADAEPNSEAVARLAEFDAALADCELTEDKSAQVYRDLAGLVAGFAL
jgi:hypothetical protein